VDNQKPELRKSHPLDYFILGLLVISSVFKDKARRSSLQTHARLIKELSHESAATQAHAPTGNSEYGFRERQKAIISKLSITSGQGILLLGQTEALQASCILELLCGTHSTASIYALINGTSLLSPNTTLHATQPVPYGRITAGRVETLRRAERL
jgi:hypothetical protein